MLEVIKKLLDCLLSYLNIKQTKENNKNVKKETTVEIAKKVAEKTEEKQKEVNKAVDNHDVDTINAIINRSVIFLFCCTLFCGCVTKYVPIYVAEDDKVIYEEKDGKPGYWVPQTTMRNLLYYKIKWESYVEAKQDVETK